MSLVKKRYTLVKVMGGLGNQMFQYAFFYAIQEMNKNSILYVDLQFYKNTQSHNGYELNTLFEIPTKYNIPDELRNKLKQIPSTDIKNIVDDNPYTYQTYEETDRQFTIYTGYWQSEKYFKKIENKIRNLYRFNENRLNKKSRLYLNEINLQENSVSIHIRRGDYMETYRNRYLYGNICTEDYYQSSIEEIGKRIKGPISYYIFCDEPEWVKQNLYISNSTVIDCNKGKESWQDMFLMSCCKHHIIANSSFSWWGAWLGSNKDKIVIAPEKWINAENTPDILPKSWVKIPVGREKIFELLDLYDTTFLVPLRIDSPERRTNLNVVIKYINSICNTHIIILEADKKQKYELSKNFTNVTYIFMEDRDPVFYRVKYINHLLHMAKTPIVGVWDSDVIIPIEQIENAIKQIRNKNAIMSFPFDGHFFNVSSQHSIVFKEKNEISFLIKNIGSHYLIFGSLSVGGGFFVEKKTYLEAGGENENFYGWGCEDIERVKRMEVLDLPVYKSYGPLFHLYHLRSQNSTYANRQNEIRNRNELLKICSKSKEELQEYIKTWNWIK